MDNLLIQMMMTFAQDGQKKNFNIKCGKIYNKLHERYAVDIRLIMRPSSLGGGRIMRRTLSVRLSVRPSRYDTERRISYCHLDSTDSCLIMQVPVHRVVPVVVHYKQMSLHPISLLQNFLE